VAIIEQPTRIVSGRAQRKMTVAAVGKRAASDGPLRPRVPGEDLPKTQSAFASDGVLDRV